MAVPPPLAFALCTLIWGTTWLAIKIGYEGLDAVWGASLRFFLAGILLATFVLARRRDVALVPRHAALILFVGVVLFGIDYGLIYWGEQFITSGLTAILFATTPLLIAVYGAAVIPQEPVTVRHIVGILLGLGGLVLIFSDQLAIDAATGVPMLAIVGAAAAAAISSVVVRRWGHDLAPSLLTAGAMLVGAVALLAASLALGEHPAWPTTQNAWLALGFLVLFGSIAGFLLFWDLLKRWGHHRTGLIVLLTPVVAVVTGLLVGERLTAWQWVGSATVLGGVGLSLWNPARARPPPTPAPAGGK